MKKRSTRRQKPQTSTTKARGKKTSTKKASSPRSSSARTSAKTDIIQLILQDHRPLKKLIKILKDSKKDLSERKAAFEEFAPALLAHAKSEEAVLYVAMKKEEDLREGGFEGDVEHGLADQMIDEVRAASDDDLWSARAKVLAELVEHHIEEEEEELLPDFKKHSKADERAAMGSKYRRLKSRLESSDVLRSEEDFAPETDSTEERAAH